ncbi:MAG TPA: hypothetical protein VND68_00175 [Chloroflexia bacterium]|jgi:hypothetical protein|nr:hypothetical protein [Chloroflexia bacterium]
MQEHGTSDRDSGPRATEPRPRWLVAVGVLLLVAMMLAAAFALGVYVAERNLFG